MPWIFFWHKDIFGVFGGVSTASCDRRNRSPFWLELRSGLCGARDRGQRPCVVPDRRGPVSGVVIVCAIMNKFRDRKSTRLNSSHQIISYAVFCLKKKKRNIYNHKTIVA